MGWGISCALPRLGWALEWALGYTWSFSPGSDWTTFHFGMLDAHQRHTLADVVRKVRGEPAALSAAGLELESGERTRSGPPRTRSR